MLDVFPILRTLPDFLLPVRGFARKVHRREHKLFMDHYLNTKEKLEKGTAQVRVIPRHKRLTNADSTQPCVCRDLVELQKKEGFSNDLAAYMSGSLLQAGSETTSAILVGFIQAMVIFPEVAKTAQEELDRVCGSRFPDLNDVPNLPYIRGCIKESLRWMPTDPLGVPHSVTCDDEYLGYLIPKNATIIFNVWCV